MRRRIRVHRAGESTFVVESEHGLVSRCTRTNDTVYVGRNERDVADELRAEGCVFVNLNARTVVQLRRGFRSREERVKPPAPPAPRLGFWHAMKNLDLYDTNAVPF